MNNMPTVLLLKNKSQDLTMSLTMRWPEAKAMELGGVDTGNMKAYELPIVAGIMKYSGFTDT